MDLLFILFKLFFDIVLKLYISFTKKRSYTFLNLILFCVIQDNVLVNGDPYVYIDWVFFHPYKNVKVFICYLLMQKMLRYSFVTY